jgi:hypothetical protein
MIKSGFDTEQQDDSREVSSSSSESKLTSNSSRSPDHLHLNNCNQNDNFFQQNHQPSLYPEGRTLSRNRSFSEKNNFEQNNYPQIHRPSYSHIRSRISSRWTSNETIVKKPQETKILNIDASLVSFIKEEIVDNAQIVRFTDIGSK